MLCPVDALRAPPCLRSRAQNRTASRSAPTAVVPDVTRWCGDLWGVREATMGVEVRTRAASARFVD